LRIADCKLQIATVVLSISNQRVLTMVHIIVSIHV